MSTPEENVVEGTGKEERFFGVRTEIKRSTSKEDAPTVIISDDDDGDAVAKPEKKLTAKEQDDAELATYSEGVKKRIKKMRWQQGEVERERDAIRAERDEAVRVTQNLYGQNRQFAQTINTGEARLVAEIKQRATNDVILAKREYADAYEKGDTTAIIEAQDKLINATSDLRTSTAYEADYNQRQTRQQQQQYQQPRQAAPVQRQVPSVPKPTEGASNWADDNPWFGDPEHADMTALAYGVHENAIKVKGIKPDTDEYFAEIDTAMRKRFPEHFTNGKVSVKTEKHAPATVVASGRRDTPKKRVEITLTQSQVRLSRKLGITPEQYAAQLIKGN